MRDHLEKYQADTRKDLQKAVQAQKQWYNWTGLTLNIQKCEWVKEEMRYLDYQLRRGEVQSQVDKVEVIRNSLRKHTKCQVRSFLGLMG
ncbi:hypothetical protein AAFF_G00177590 [Aldrovandia affinis]|uniref:Uncharacterized protein n=1 Tax=Aldrovandia affinis TaxID=143900 RepID=A0AAD7W7B4_9TELE|nr:hypothetical protein AAFF_G00177590 [Aldrovandia affinis]